MENDPFHSLGHVRRRVSRQSVDECHTENNSGTCVFCFWMLFVHYDIPTFLFPYTPTSKWLECIGNDCLSIHMSEKWMPQRCLQDARQSYHCSGRSGQNHGAERRGLHPKMSSGHLRDFSRGLCARSVPVKPEEPRQEWPQSLVLELKT